MRNSCLLWFVLVGLLTGCSSGNLDRTTALKKIKAATEGDQTLRIWVGRVGSHCSFFEFQGKRDPIDMNPDKDIETIVAVKAGYATVASDGKDYWRVDLTEKGKRSLIDDPFQIREANAGCDSHLAKFAVATSQVVEVTGVTATAHDGSCLVEYRWKWISTELGKTLQADGNVYKQLTLKDRVLLRGLINNSSGQWLEIPVPSEAILKPGRSTFRKYDDGWRLQ